MYDTSLKRKWDTANVIDYARKEGAEQKGYSVVANLIQQLGLDDAAAAGVAEVSIDFVKKTILDAGLVRGSGTHQIRAELAKKKK